MLIEYLEKWAKIRPKKDKPIRKKALIYPR